MDSVEALDRMKFNAKRMTDGRALKGQRMKMKFAETPLKDVQVKIVADKSNPERVRFDYGPLICLIREDGEYDHYSPDEVPDVTDDVKERLKKCKQPILTIGVSEEESSAILKDKGYLDENSKYSDVRAEDILGTEDILFSVKDVNDPIKRRLAAKTAFNYLCLKKGVDYVLQEKFDPIREYIRYGNWDAEKLQFFFKNEPVEFCDLPNEHSHAVGFAWSITDDSAYFIGVVTWYGQMTYEIRLFEDRDAFIKYRIGDTTVIAQNKKIEDTWMLYSDNDTRIQTEEEAVFIVNNMSGA